MGNTLSMNNMIVRNLVNLSNGVRIEPLTRLEVDDLA